mmetsp:Transcript_29226/g.63426  ORF Transcript_29226/g.63426 Transcript_29226/m.63426 type:complete len:206 (-) Transcript_29226:78-695(-)|eukprot:CAMPEP_0178657656 /NCGR_PEP_ID=MMETSP0698-20121128/25521_1 /TAXON_ID=265572 /ORGANISM="Extubocellulus spinifer, Strain CCMP396" /LENGTH=205 /DNA_ID=CAMNT_0020299887 /DNA_START=8 /DNA_END=625 /DNA_ORIENTATION=-
MIGIVKHLHVLVKLAILFLGLGLTKAAAASYDITVDWIIASECRDCTLEGYVTGDPSTNLVNAQYKIEGLAVDDIWTNPNASGERVHLERATNAFAELRWLVDIPGDFEVCSFDYTFTIPLDDGFGQTPPGVRVKTCFPQEGQTYYTYATVSVIATNDPPSEEVTTTDPPTMTTDPSSESDSGFFRAKTVSHCLVGIVGFLLVMV